MREDSPSHLHYPGSGDGIFTQIIQGEHKILARALKLAIEVDPLVLLQLTDTFCSLS